jgi:hypothetical protein
MNVRRRSQILMRAVPNPGPLAELPCLPFASMARLNAGTMQELCRNFAGTCYKERGAAGEGMVGGRFAGDVEMML